MISSNKFAACVAFGLVLSAWGFPAAAQFSVAVRHNPQDAAQTTCLQALQDAAPAAQIPGLVVVSADSKPTGPAPVTLDLDGLSWSSAIEVIGVPFAIRDAAHFQAFMKSDLYKQLQQIDRAQERPSIWLSIAYGGFYQLFSRSVAMTEPKHFYEQLVGGAEHARMYDKFKARMMVAAPGVFEQVMYSVNYDASRMAAKDSHIVAVEAPLISAYEYELQKRARFVNLTFSAFHPIFFHVDGDERTWNALPPVTRDKLARWVETAAQNCSAANFKAEQATLERLKKDGLTIVPVNRPVFIEAGWTHGMTWVIPNIRWTVEDLDKLVALDAKPAPKRLPSALVASLPVKDRDKLRGQNKTLMDERQASLSRPAATPESDNALTLWRSGVDALGDELRSNGSAILASLNAPPPGPRPRPGVKSPDAVRAMIAALEERLNAVDIPQRCVSNCLMPITALCQAARASWALGDDAGVEKFFAVADRLAARTVRTNESHMAELMVIARAKTLAGHLQAKAAVGAAVEAAAAEKEQFLRVNNVTRLAVLAQMAGDKLLSLKLFKQASDLAQAETTRQAENLDTLGQALLEAGNGKAAVSLFATALETVSEPRDLIIRLYPPLRLSPAVGKILGPRAARFFEQLAEAVRPTGFYDPDERDGRTWLRTDWLSLTESAALMWFAADDMDALKRLREMVKGYEKSAKPNERDRFTDAYKLIDNRIAQIYYKRGDLDAARAADANYVKNALVSKQSTEAGDWEGQLRRAESMSPSTERTTLLRAIINGAAKAGQVEIVRRAIVPLHLESASLWGAAVVAAAGIEN